MSQTVFAYRCGVGLNVKISSLLLDDIDYTAEAINTDHSEIDLTNVALDWKTLCFRINLSDPYELSKEFLRLSPTRETISDLKGCVRLICKETDFRKGFDLEQRGLSWDGVITIERKNVHSKIKMDAFICRNSTYERDDNDAYATETGHRILFVGEDQYNWTINLDQSESTDIGSLLKGKWQSFKKYERFENRNDRGKLDWFLDLYDLSSPQLLLNSDSKDFKRVMVPRGTEGTKAKTSRLIIENQIDCDVKLQLIMASLNYYSTYEDVTETEGSMKLYWDVLKWIKQNLWNQNEISEILEKHGDRENTSSMITEISAFLQVDAGNQKGFRNLVRNVVGA
jgi:hypothetical protein